MRHFRAFLCMGLLTAFVCTSAMIVAVSDISKTALKHGEIRGNLAEALTQLAYSTKTPIIGELAQPLVSIHVSEGIHSPEDLVRELVRQAPGYKWESRGKVMLFYREDLQRNALNILNLKFERFTMPNNVSQLKYALPNMETGLLDRTSEKGILLTGFGDTELQKDSLKGEVIEDINGREILVRAANQNPTFSVILVFPKGTLRTTSESKQVEWFWQSFRSELKPMYLQVPEQR
jgi:hypothetical protein